MFGSPVRISGKNGETVFQLDVNATPLGVSVELNKDGLVYDKDVQPRFRTLQSLIISELAKERELFRNPPSLASLEAITPNWGFVSSGGKMIFSPYAKILFDAGDDKLPCLVDIQLKQLMISRSTIQPMFKLHYLGPAGIAIDFDWSPQRPMSGDEIVEVSDVSTSTAGPLLTLADPAIRAREKEEKKLQVREAFAAAQNARKAAETLAQSFYDTYELSDSESAFTEWLSESDEESDSE